MAAYMCLTYGWSLNPDSSEGLDGKEGGEANVDPVDGPVFV